MALAERLVERPSKQQTAPIPMDLVNVAALESEPWAREEALKAMTEQYAELGSWDEVRHQHIGRRF